MIRSARRMGVLGVLLVTACTAVPATASADENDFSCRASGVRVNLLGLARLEPFVANPADRPCRDDHAGVLAPTTVGPVRVSVVDVNTSNGDNDRGHADATVTNVRIAATGIPTITANVLSSSSDVTCVNGQPRFASDSEVVGLRVGSTTVLVPDGEAKVVNAGPLAQLTLNEFDTTSTGPGEQRLTRRALHLRSRALNTDIVIAESTANVHGNPCDDTPPPPECSDGVDNLDPEDPVADANDPGCHTDGDPNDGDNTYDPNDNDETDKPECSDGGDNADPEDPLADIDDPGCHTDGNPNNPESYNPNDDDERDVAGPKPQCSNGGDDDGDKLIDDDDPGCHSDGDPNNPESYNPNDNDETDDKTAPECGDGNDNDDDKAVDEDDPQCHTDGDPTNKDSYDPDRSES